MARRAGRQGLRRHHGQLLRPLRQAARGGGLGRARGRRGRVRAQALRDPPRGGDRRGPRPRGAELQLAHDRLQGDAHLPAAARLLPRPAGRALRLGAGPRPLALLHEHLPELGARAPVPDDRPQRRDQHAARQRQLDARARVAARQRAVRRRPAEGAARRAARRLGLRDVRQRARAARARRPIAAARGDDDGARGLRRPRRHPGAPARLLRLPLVPDGAVGRPRRRRLHGRPRDRRDAGPQRPAPRPLAGDQGRLGRPGLGDRRDGRAGREHRAQGPAPARQALPRRPRGRRDRRRRGRQARGLHAGALRRVVRGGHRAARRPAGARAVLRAACVGARAPARLRLLPGGPAGPAGADGRQGRGADRLDGQRPGARGAERPPAAAVQLLQAALRAGHQPADRPDPRGDRDERRHGRGLRAQPARRGARARAPARDEDADPAQRRAGEAAPGRLERLRARARWTSRGRSPRAPRGSTPPSTACAPRRARRSPTASTS